MENIYVVNTEVAALQWCQPFLAIVIVLEETPADSWEISYSQWSELAGYKAWAATAHLTSYKAESTGKIKLNQRQVGWSGRDTEASGVWVSPTPIPFIEVTWAHFA